MKKQPIKHFVPNIDRRGDSGGVGGIPVGNCFNKNLPAWTGFGEIAKTRRGVTCGTCRRTRVFKGEVFRGEK